VSSKCTNRKLLIKNQFLQLNDIQDYGPSS
jgi:hypothetical protein